MKEDPFEGVIWRNVLDLGIHGMGWRDESREQPYDRVYGDAAFVPERQRVYQEKNASLQKVYDQAAAAGIKDLHIYFADSWFGDDFEGTSDASHPNDLGAWRMAESLTPLVQQWITQ